MEPQKPRVNVSHVENISTVSYLNVFTYRTDHTLKEVLAEKYFNNMHGLERHDRIEITSSADAERPEHATLVVTAAELGVGVTVAVLRGPERTEAAA